MNKSSNLCMFKSQSKRRERLTREVDRGRGDLIYKMLEKRKMITAALKDLELDVQTKTLSL